MSWGVLKIAVNYFQNQTMEVRNRVSGLLEKYKVSNVGVYESEHPLWAIWDEIDNGRPAICFVRGLTQSKNDQEVLSFLIDDYEVRDQSLLYKYYNHAEIRRDFQEYFVSVKFQHIMLILSSRMLTTIGLCLILTIPV